MTEFAWGKQTYLMGIVNATPDSFSGDGLVDRAAAVERGIRLVGEGADMLDIGGESTRPGATPVSLEEELSRVVPLVRALAAAVRVPISIDTYKAEVARQALEAGASIINDVWAGLMDPQMFAVAAQLRAPIILMHNRSRANDAAQEATLGGRYVGVEYQDLIGDIKRELQERIDAALAAGIDKGNIIIDPGIGFGKTVEQNLEIVRRLDAFRSLGCPILVGPSRKSFVGYTLDLPPSERIEGTAAAVALCIQNGADVVRVHDVREMKRAAAFADAVARPRLPRVVR